MSCADWLLLLETLLISDCRSLFELPLLRGVLVEIVDAVVPEVDDIGEDEFVVR